MGVFVRGQGVQGGPSTVSCVCCTVVCVQIRFLRISVYYRVMFDHSYKRVPPCFELFHL
jgi:hypothetical protein